MMCVVIATRATVASTKIATADATSVVIEIWNLFDSREDLSLTSASSAGIA